MSFLKFMMLFFFFLFFLASEGREIVLPQTPFSTYEDTEGTISLPLPALQENDREFSCRFQWLQQRAIIWR